MRFLTTAAAIVIFAMGLKQGWGVVRFSMLPSELAAEEGPDTFVPWVDVSGVMFPARDLVLTAIAASRSDNQDPKLLDEISEILSVKPLSAGYWLSLAKLQFANQQPYDQVMDAWSLSVLTGPNEGNVLPWRGLFGLVLWENASNEVKERTIADLSAAVADFTEQQKSTAQVLMARKTEQNRQDIRARLLADGAPENRLSNVGL